MVAEMPEFEIKDGVLVCYNGCEETVIVPKGVTEIGFREAGYQERYVYGRYHSFNYGFYIHYNDNTAALKYIAFHKLSLRMVRS